jgi:AraC family transcriptional regulator
MSSASASEEFQNPQSPLSAIPYDRIKDCGLRVSVMSDPPGVVEMPALRYTFVSIHIGPSVYVSCRKGGHSHHGTVVHGDIDIIPAGTPGRWEMKDKDTALLLSLSPKLLDMVAEQFDLDPRRIEIRSRFQERDPQLESIGWALKAEMESGYPCGRLYFDSLAVAVAARLVRCHSSLALEPGKQNGRMTDRRLRQVVAYIEDNLNQDMSLGEIAAVAGVSVSHFKTLFRESVGLPVHQYVIRRRLERARVLLAERELSISQIACETGFAHQSHLARHMRRVLGVSPKALREMLG